MFESIKNMFRNPYVPEKERKKSLKDRVKELEKTVEKLEKASFIPIEIGGDRSFFHPHEWVGVSNLLDELLDDLGYKLVYREEVKKKRCLIRKKKH
jgi:hypothetical protein